MTSPSKQKGSKAERDVVKYLNERGYTYADRRLAGDTNDKGDVSGVNGVCFEIKNQQRMNLAGWIEELKTEIINSKSTTGVVVHKRKGKTDVTEWYATMPFGMWLDLLEKAGYRKE